ncbi:MAG: NAD(+) synthase, partial [Erysipelothrix sp.]|nr:NAD(+) synthase [Erysipelothrix sp.]
DRVIGANLSTRHNSERTIKNAKWLTEKLGVQLVETSIEHLVKETLASMKDFGYNQLEGLAYENIQARLRGHLLSTLSSLNNGLVSNNTNKIESALGYGTLYGDTIGAIGFLADCTKMDVVRLAVEINKAYGQEVVPQNLLPKETEQGLEWDFMPSAELAENQRDPMKWGYHDYLVNRLLQGHSQLEEILMDYKNKVLHTSTVGKYLSVYGLDEPKEFIKDLLWVVKNMNRNVFKRIQGAPTLVVSDKVIGLDTHEIQGPLIMSKKAKQLIKEIENA